MKNRILIIVLAIIVIAAGFGVWKFVFDKSSDSDNTNTTTSSTNEHPGQSYTTAEVATHNSQEDCWTIIDGDVYDITDYISQHPGGAEILRACGTDATTLFTQRTTTDGQAVGSGTPHSSQAQSSLSQYHIGTLGS